MIGDLWVMCCPLLLFSPSQQSQSWQMSVPCVYSTSKSSSNIQFKFPCLQGTHSQFFIPYIMICLSLPLHTPQVQICFQSAFCEQVKVYYQLLSANVCEAKRRLIPLTSPQKTHKPSSAGVSRKTLMDSSGQCNPWCQRLDGQIHGLLLDKAVKIQPAKLLHFACFYKTVSTSPLLKCFQVLYAGIKMQEVGPLLRISIVHHNYSFYISFKSCFCSKQIK